MGLPFWELPGTLCIGGISYPIDTDFRAGIRVRQMFSDPYLSARPNRLLEFVGEVLFFGTVPGGEDCDWVLPVLWYLTDGRMSPGRLSERLARRQAHFAAAGDGGEEICSYLWDMPEIWAAFYTSYGIDLLTAQLHLWQFDALLGSLDEGCAWKRNTALRAMSVDDYEEGARQALAVDKLAVRIPDREELYRAALARAGRCSFATTETDARPDASRRASAPPCRTSEHSEP